MSEDKFDRDDQHDNEPAGSPLLWITGCTVCAVRPLPSKYPVDPGRILPDTMGETETQVGSRAYFMRYR